MIEIVIYFNYKNIKYNYSKNILIISLISLYTVSFISEKTEIKEKKRRIVLAENRGTEKDPIAEYLLEDISNKLKKDDYVKYYLQFHNEKIDSLLNYLQKKYFNLYLEKYNLEISICTSIDSILLNPREKAKDCYNFYDGIKKLQGIKLFNSDFYFLDNVNGRISYFGKFEFEYFYKEEKFISLFILLNSKLVNEELGYPELLLNKKTIKKSNLKKYSFAKYKNNYLVSKTGHFSYSLDREIYKRKDKEYYFFDLDDYNHLIYNFSENNTIIVSKLKRNFLDILISFSYIFAFFHFVLLIFMILGKFYRRKNFHFHFHLNFKIKMQIAIIFILLFSSILITSATIFYNTKQYEKKQVSNLKEKIQSVLIELEHSFIHLKKIPKIWFSDDYESLDELLRKFAGIFYTDIHLYDTDGNLMASSRNEIFDRGLMSLKIHPTVYRKIILEKKTVFIHNENIGELDYISAYTPLINNKNKVLAYLCLPYFTKQNLLEEEISNLIVAEINLYVFLILLSSMIAVFISNKITRPLALIQEKFKNIKLKTYEKIEYNGKDEVGDLVKEYNRMLIELEKNIELLSQSERESAWREMAKQIAHEIKNPLTPMKLHIQMLLRSWENKDANFEMRLKRTSKNIIEQVNALSKIATEFSNFAKMPKANNTVFNIVEVLNDTVRLFENEEVKILTLFRDKEINVFADKEQITRVFINLIKNGIQAVPEDKKGRINVYLEKDEEFVITQLQDNGAGINDEVKEKLFRPNFTTKSSGMGMGLAIVKNIIESANGKIWFETKINIGTTFFVKLPIYNK